MSSGWMMGRFGGCSKSIEQTCTYMNKAVVADKGDFQVAQRTRTRTYDHRISNA